MAARGEAWRRPAPSRLAASRCSSPLVLLCACGFPLALRRGCGACREALAFPALVLAMLFTAGAAAVPGGSPSHCSVAGGALPGRRSPSPRSSSRCSSSLVVLQCLRVPPCTAAWRAVLCREAFALPALVFAMFFVVGAAAVLEGSPSHCSVACGALPGGVRPPRARLRDALRRWGRCSAWGFPLALQRGVRGPAGDVRPPRSRLAMLLAAGAAAVLGVPLALQRGVRSSTGRRPPSPRSTSSRSSSRCSSSLELLRCLRAIPRTAARRAVPAAPRTAVWQAGLRWEVFHPGPSSLDGAAREPLVEGAASRRCS